MRVYIVLVPLAGGEEGYPIARCAEGDVAAELVRVLLRARACAPDKVVVKVEEEVRADVPY